MSFVRLISPARRWGKNDARTKPVFHWRSGAFAAFGLVLPWAMMVLHRLATGSGAFLPPVEIKATAACMMVVLVTGLTRGSPMVRAVQVVGLAIIAVAGLAVFAPQAARIGYVSIAFIAAISGLLMLAAQHLARPVRAAAVSSDTQTGQADTPVELRRDADLVNAPYEALQINHEHADAPFWSRYTDKSGRAATRVESLAEHLERATGRVILSRHRPDELTRGIRNARIWPAVKRCFDLACVLLMAPSALLFSGLAMLAILITMGRPIIFAQDRIGKDGRVFRMFKLRTMRNRRAGEAQIATAVNDNRITPLGKALRRTHIDELPQLWNVLIGEMSMIGPRPEQPGLVEKYASLIPNYAVRHAVRPGITGWSQVRFGYAETVEETARKLEYDLYYIRDFGPRIDVSIVFRTVLVMFNSAYVR